MPCMRPFQRIHLVEPIRLSKKPVTQSLRKKKMKTRKRKMTKTRTKTVKKAKKAKAVMKKKRKKKRRMKKKMRMPFLTKSSRQWAQRTGSSCTTRRCVENTMRSNLITS